MRVSERCVTCLYEKQLRLSDNLDDDTYARFLERLSQAKTLLLLCDNCGEVVLDKLFWSR